MSFNTENSPDANLADDKSRDLIKRYLHAIGMHLPTLRREDILAELSANLLAEVDDQEALLGRRLTPAEESALLKTHDRPFLAAARYRPQQYLIGPAVFPYYWLVLRISLTLSALLYLLANAVELAVSGASASGIFGILARLPFTLLITAGWVTLTFVALELMRSRQPAMLPLHSGWKPESLPVIIPGSTSMPRAIGDLLVNLGGAVWLAVVPRYPYLLLGPGARYFTSGTLSVTPPLRAMYWVVVALLFVPVLLKAAILGRTLSARQRLMTHTAGTGAWLLIFVLLLRVRDYFTVVGTGAEQATYRSVADVFNTVTLTSLRIGLAVTVLSMVWNAGRYFLKVRGPMTRTWREGSHIQG